MAIQDLVRLPINSFVVPVGYINGEGNFELEGTAFLIGKRGFMITAAHVAEALKNTLKPIAIFPNGPVYYGIDIIAFECHPSEDVAVLKLSDGEWSSIHTLSGTTHYGSAEVMMWAYPENVAKEQRQAATPGDSAAATIRPDLIYFQGYIRRQINWELPVGILRGSAFYEVSQIGGSCASGAPVTLRAAGQKWAVIGVYVGEQTGDARREIGLVVRSDAFQDWVPAVLGNAVSAERSTH